MGILALLAFFYGVIGGAMGSIVFFLVTFRKGEAFLCDTVRRKARKHAEFDAVAKEAAAVAPARVETLCKLVRFDGGIVGEAIQCRMVFYGSSIDIYQVDKLRTLPDHRQEVVSEHMLGRINRACVTASSQRISKYHRHRNQNTRYAAIKGKCTVLSHKDDMPLFIEDPKTVLKERLQQAKERQAYEAMMERLLRRARRQSRAMTDEELAAELNRMQLEARIESRDRYNRSANISDYQHDLLGNGASYQAAFTSQRRSFDDAPWRRRNDLSADALEEVPLSQWKCVAIKFPTRRVQERWLNLLQPTPESGQWHDFITRLPQVDVFNLLIARLFFENSRANALHDLLEEKLKRKLARVSKSLPPKLRGNIFLDALDVGGEIPLISNVSEPASSKCGDTEFDFDVLYRGGLALKIRFSVLYRDIRVPDIIFSIKVLELAGRMRFVVGPPPTRKFWLGGPQPPQLRLDFTQEVASHDGILNAVLRLLPDMSKIASNVVTVMLFEDMVLPNMDDFPWPVLGDNSDDDDSGTARSDAERVEKKPQGSRESLQGRESGSQDRAGREERRSSSTGAGAALDNKRGNEDGATSRQATAAKLASHLDATPARRRSARSPSVASETSPPFLQPLVLHSNSAPCVEVPQLRPSSCGALDKDQDSGTPSPQCQPPRFSLRLHSASPSTTPHHALPPRPPRVASFDFAHGKSACVPTSRALGSLGSCSSSERGERALFDSLGDSRRSVSGSSSGGGG
ncbi:hypothetical protein LSCM1_07893 [Leishmania martiniquensis]|uniref:SMP-LTD domain-containing protein n=1 Tax=Leishmania martiniquensis TaxID=1580590 RepID=A0A836HNB2_9TRYP|nr:hypothetical protein LSCM1_07893 [Leishmania martiniquensis]